MKASGRIINTPTKTEAPVKLTKNATPDLTTIISRLRLSLPIMRAAQVDASIRRLMLAQMVKMTLEEGDALVLPESARVQFVDNANYETYRKT